MDLNEVARRLGPVVDHPLGLAATLAPRTRSSDSAPNIVLARFAIPNVITVVGAQQNWSHGTSSRMEDARTLALVEALERYNGLLPPIAHTESCYDDIADLALDPQELPLFSTKQYCLPNFPFKPFRRDRPLKWVRGFNLTRNQPILVPASATGYGQDDDLLSDCSSGVAAHSSRGVALLNAALEVVERDAFMIHWLNRLTPRKLELHDEDSAHFVRLLQEQDYELHVLDLTTDLQIPVCLAAGIHRQQRKPALIIGAGASLSPRTALRRALHEVFAASMSTGALWQPEPFIQPHEVTTLSDHSRAYSHPHWLCEASFLWASEKRTALRAEPERTHLDVLVEQLGNYGHEVIGVDITAADVASCGLTVVRAIVPGLQPLAIYPGPRLGGRRVFDAPVRMGYRTRPLEEDELNLIPHCFP